MQISVGREYRPNYLRVKRGDTVQFLWEEDGPSVTEREGMFDTGSLQKGSRFDLKIVDQLPRYIHYHSKNGGISGLIEVDDHLPFDLTVRGIDDRREEKVESKEDKSDPYNDYLNRYPTPKTRTIKLDENRFYSDIF